MPVDLTKKKDFSLFCKTSLHIFSSLKGNLRAFNAFLAVMAQHDSRTEPDLMNKWGVRVSRTLNHELFACMCAGALSFKNKTHLDSFRRLFLKISSCRMVSNVE